MFDSAPPAMIGGQCRTANFLARENSRSIEIDADRYVGDLDESDSPSCLAFRGRAAKIPYVHGVTSSTAVDATALVAACIVIVTGVIPTPAD